MIRFAGREPAQSAMSRYRLRFRNTDLEMPLGEFVVGRSATCHLALDDALVSRRHAILRATEETVTVEDLGSRNGVLVNGERITAPRRLEHGDLVTIGDHELRLVDRRAGPTSDPGAAARRRAAAAPAPGREKRTAELDLAELAAGPLDAPESSRELAAFRLVAGIAEKALGLGRYDDAERILERHLEGALERSRRGGAVDPEVIEKATEYALQLAGGPRASRFIGYVIELHTASRKLMAESVIDRLHELVRKSRYRERAPIDAYLALLGTMARELSAADRFVVRRLTALSRVIAA